MQTYIQILIFAIIGVALLWFGYRLLIGPWIKIRWFRDRPWLFKIAGSGDGTFQTCPLCSSRLSKGDLLDTSVFPSISEGRDRLMHIRGCLYCLTGNLERYCPVCGAPLGDGDILVARMFERTHGRRSHVHILGCSRCRKLGIV